MIFQLSTLILVHDQVYDRIALETHISTVLERDKYEFIIADPVTQNDICVDGTTLVFDLAPDVQTIKNLRYDYESRETKR